MPYNNLTINFTQQVYVDSFIVDNTSIYLENFRRSGTEYITMNLTSANKNYTGDDLPYFAQTSLTEKTISKTITSNLTDSVNVTIIVADASLLYHDCNDVISVTLNGVAQSYTCNSPLTLIGTLLPGNNTLAINFAYAEQDMCSSFTSGIDQISGKIGMILMIIGISILIGGVAIFLFIYNGNTIETSFSMQDVAPYIIGIGFLIFSVIIALIVASVVCTI